MKSLILRRIKTFVSCLIIIHLYFLVPVLFFDNAIAESQNEGTAKLVEGAKKEGKMSFYTAISVKDAQMLTEGFTKKYPFMKIELVGLGGERLATRILNEFRAKKYLTDIVMDTATTFILQKEGLVMKYVSPESKFYPEGFKDPHGLWTGAIMVTRVLGYNTKQVDPRNAPKRYEDLLDPKWKGKIGMDTENTEWLYAQLKIMGREKGMDFMKRLSDQNIQFRTGRTLLAQLLAAGEFSISVPVAGHQIEQLKRQGAAVEWIGIEPVVTLATPIMVMAQAPHPNASKLFVDFVLSVEGQTIIRNMNRIPIRPDVPPDPPRLTQGLKLWPPDFSLMDHLNEYVQLYNSIFLKRGGK